MAEITLPHLLRLANEQGCSVSREQALAFLNEQGRAFEMWKHSRKSKSSDPKTVSTAP